MTWATICWEHRETQAEWARGPAEAISALVPPHAAMAALLPGMRQESFAGGDAVLRRRMATDAACYRWRARRW